MQSLLNYIPFSVRRKAPGRHQLSKLERYRASARRKFRYNKMTYKLKEPKQIVGFIDQAPVV